MTKFMRSKLLVKQLNGFRFNTERTPAVGIAHRLTFLLASRRS